MYTYIEIGGGGVNQKAVIYKQVTLKVSFNNKLVARVKFGKTQINVG